MKIEITIKDENSYVLHCDDWPEFFHIFPKIAGRIYGAVIKKLKPDISEERRGRLMADTGILFMQGIDDGAGEFREGFTRFTVRGEEHIRVAAQMEATLMQYELSWRHLHGLIGASILYAEMLRIEPYEDYTELFSYLMLSGELMRHGILPPLLEKDMADEEKAAFSLAIGRGNYADFTAFIERAVESSYREAGHV